ncbi:putative enzyme yhhN [Salmonella enterica subsp. arizonae]|uniref:Putative enzyme yhhN n=1 Tax=Salmonella enterica subsp. arizonae TaxID=59203 RepID=A0A447QWZ2_SALER|nr:putative enzyme yhhN [Salmonella enterica subsp. arizonae]
MLWSFIAVCLSAWLYVDASLSRASLATLGF